MSCAARAALICPLSRRQRENMIMHREHAHLCLQDTQQVASDAADLAWLKLRGVSHISSSSRAANLVLSSEKLHSLQTVFTAAVDNGLVEQRWNTFKPSPRARSRYM